ncbi:MAG: hypothetical protein H0V97_06375 [Actinobacteria bacterium]|nr:hypothetical protein [Actinomycetota bacterium]
MAARSRVSIVISVCLAATMLNAKWQYWRPDVGGPAVPTPVDDRIFEEGLIALSTAISTILQIFDSKPVCASLRWRDGVLEGSELLELSRLVSRLLWMLGLPHSALEPRIFTFPVALRPAARRAVATVPP